MNDSIGQLRRTVSIGDAHCHLADLTDPDASVAEAVAAGVAPILAVAMGPEDGARVLDLKRKHPGLVLAGLGLHPSRVPGLLDAQVDAELALIAERISQADFVGEIGLDYRDAVTPRDRARQRDVLERLLDVAAGARLPVNMHTRRADSDLVDLAARFTKRTGLAVLLHWFTHSERLARRCAEEGIYISTGPSIEIDSRQARVAAEIDARLLLVETDSPVAYGGRAARPAWARRVAEALGRARGEEPGTLAVALADNLARYLNLVTTVDADPLS